MCYGQSNKYFNRLCEVWSQRGEARLSGRCKCYWNDKLTATPKMISWSPNSFLSVICNTWYYFVCTWKSNLGTILPLSARVNWANQIISWENVILPSWCYLHHYAAAALLPRVAAAASSLPAVCDTQVFNRDKQRVPARERGLLGITRLPPNIRMGRWNTQIKIIKPLGSCSSFPEL